MATVRDLVEAAMREIGVLAEGETATASQALDAFVRLNRFVDRLATERLTIYTRTKTQWTLVASQGTYTVGPLLTDVQIARPIFIDDVRFLDGAQNPDVELPLAKLTEKMYAEIPVKTEEATFPRAWYYNPTATNGTLILWPAPTSDDLTGVMYAWTALTQFASINTSISLPPAYEEMLLSNLAVLLCPSYERQPHPVTAKVAVDSMAALKRVNIRPQDMSFAPEAMISSTRSGYDILEG